MGMFGDRQRGSLRRDDVGAVLLLAGLLAVVMFIIGTGSIRVHALDPNVPIDPIQDVDFGIVIPGETYVEDFVVCIKDPEPDDQVSYSLALNPNGSLPDMTPFLDFERASSEPDAGADTLAGATLDSPDDECDRWVVTLIAPHCEGAYNQFTDPQGNGATIPCDVDRPTDDPQTWSEGADPGAQVGVEVPAVAAEAVQMPVALPATGGEPAVTP